MLCIVSIHLSILFDASYTVISLHLESTLGRGRPPKNPKDGKLPVEPPDELPVEPPVEPHGPSLPHNKAAPPVKL